MLLSDDEWKQRLTTDQYAVLRQKGTETPFSGEYLSPKDNGTFACVGCGNNLFTSDSQYESRLPGLEGWPSFADVAHSHAVELRQDSSLGIDRIEVVCKKCGGHIGHVFEGDPDSPSGKHYCINSVCLKFAPAHKKD